MKRLFFCLAVLGVILTGCSKNDDGESDKPNNNGNEQPENPNEPELPELPALPDPDDVCSAMDDLNFMAYCYENFDVNKDGKVSVTEANYGQTNEMYKEDSRINVTADRKPIPYSRASNFGSKNEMYIYLYLLGFYLYSWPVFAVTFVFHLYFAWTVVVLRALLRVLPRYKGVRLRNRPKPGKSRLLIFAPHEVFGFWPLIIPHSQKLYI